MVQIPIPLKPETNPIHYLLVYTDWQNLVGL